MGEVVKVAKVIINGFVTEKLLAQSSGLGNAALSHYRREGKVHEGVQYIVAENGRIMWDVEEFNKWLKGSKYTKARSGSGLNGKASVATRRQTSSPTLRV